MKVDLKRNIATYSAPRGRFEVVPVPTMRFVMIDGHGDPNTAAAYRDAVATLFPLAYRLRSLSRSELDRDHTVMPLEALWWSADLQAFTAERDESAWDWTVMIMTPDWLTDEHVASAMTAVRGGGRAPALDLVRLEALDEGLAVQTLHIGPYETEGPTLAAMHEAFIPVEGLEPTGKHHETYLGDPRRTAPERLRTILRQPVRSIAR